MRGSTISARAIATRCRWPPESWCGIAEAVLAAEPDFGAARRRCALGVARGRGCASGALSVWSTVWLGCSEPYGSWNTICNISPRARACAAAASPRRRVPPRPRRAGSGPATARSTVDLPRAGFADQPERLAGGDGEGDVARRRRCRARRCRSVTRHVDRARITRRPPPRPGSRCNCGSSARRWPSSGSDGEQAARVGMLRLAQLGRRRRSRRRGRRTSPARGRRTTTTRCRLWLMRISPMPRPRTSSSRIASTCVLHRDVERRGRFVGDQHVGAGDQHHGDHHALAHAAGDLVRIEADRRARGRGCARRASISSAACARRACAAAEMAAVRLGDLLADAHHRIEREFRVLQHHRDALAAQPAKAALVEAAQVDVAEAHLVGADAAGARHQPQDGAARAWICRSRIRRRCRAARAPSVKRDVAHRWKSPCVGGDSSRAGCAPSAAAASLMRRAHRPRRAARRRAG